MPLSLPISVVLKIFFFLKHLNKINALPPKPAIDEFVLSPPQISTSTQARWKEESSMLCICILTAGILLLSEYNDQPFRWLAAVLIEHKFSNKPICDRAIIRSTSHKWNCEPAGKSNGFTLSEAHNHLLLLRLLGANGILCMIWVTQVAAYIEQ